MFWRKTTQHYIFLSDVLWTSKFCKFLVLPANGGTGELNPPFQWRPWWRHQMETFSALLALCAGNSPVPGERPVTRSCDVFFDLRLNKRLSKQSWGWWFETPSHSLWRHCNAREHHGVPNHPPLYCLFISLTRFTTTKISAPLITGPLWKESTGVCLTNMF